MLLNQFSKPLAIAMWDSSWLRRRFAGGGFEDYDKAVLEIKERGYDAVRIDAFPHLIAPQKDGTVRDIFRDLPGYHLHNYGFAQWGSPWTVYIEPRKHIVELIKACEKHGVYVGLSTWMKPTEEPLNEAVSSAQDFIHIWDETLKYLENSDCLSNIVFLDIYNEYPGYNSFVWLHSQRVRLKNDEQALLDFDNNFLCTVISALKKKWPAISIGCCGEARYKIDYSCCDFVDVHTWVINDVIEPNDKDLLANFGKPDHMYIETITGPNGYKRNIPFDIKYEELNERIHRSWKENQKEIVEKLERSIINAAALGKRHNVIVGCSEGWGPIFWYEHPMLSWDFCKEVGMEAAKLANKHGYKFICSSNFCEPQFIRMWRDIEYHKRITAEIKK